MVVVDTTDEEEHPEEDSKKVNTEESKDSENSMNFEGLKYNRDPKDFDL